MKTLVAALSILAFATAARADVSKAKAAAAADKKALSCTTPGDALGGLTFVLSGKNVIMTEHGMDDSTTRYTLNNSGFAEDGVPAFAAGKASTLYYRTKKSTEFGGAVSEAGLVSLGGKPAAGKQRTGYLSRRGTVYILTCQN